MTGNATNIIVTAEVMSNKLRVNNMGISLKLIPKASLPFFGKLRLECAVPVPWRLHFHMTEISFQGFRGVSIAGIARLQPIWVILKVTQMGFRPLF